MLSHSSYRRTALVSASVLALFVACGGQSNDSDTGECLPAKAAANKLAAEDHRPWGRAARGRVAGLRAPPRAQEVVRELVKPVGVVRPVAVRVPVGRAVAARERLVSVVAEAPAEG